MFEKRLEALLQNLILGHLELLGNLFDDLFGFCRHILIPPGAATIPSETLDDNQAVSDDVGHLLEQAGMDWLAV
ncbi:MAG TPA: hypothetical protein ENI60_01370 [Candidatus Fraserbacteria bacterium]|nr:hypothetical protein [Candidatus Fraserbacteria bacterium]